MAARAGTAGSLGAIGAIFHQATGDYFVADLAEFEVKCVVQAHGVHDGVRTFTPTV